jgi:hypothetical protein
MGLVLIPGFGRNSLDIYLNLLLNVINSWCGWLFTKGNQPIEQGKVKLKKPPNGERFFLEREKYWRL